MNAAVAEMKLYKYEKTSNTSQPIFDRYDTLITYTMVMEYIRQVTDKFLVTNC